MQIAHFLDFLSVDLDKGGEKGQMLVQSEMDLNGTSNLFDCS